jgi:predicted nucleic acid-binding protein
MSGPHFVDSNILVYRHDRDEATKQRAAQQLLERLWKTRSGRVSDQVLHEFYVVATRKLAKPVPLATARAEVRQLETWRPIASSPALREAAFELEDRFSLSWWDALIVAAAMEAGCVTLLSEDLQDGLDVDGLLVRNPFAHADALADLGL